MFKDSFYFALKVNKSKILCLAILLKFFTLTIFHKTFGTNLSSASGIQQNNKESLLLQAVAAADLDAMNRQNKTFLHVAAENGNVRGLELLLVTEPDLRDNANAVDYQGMTPLLLAAEKGKVEVFELLLAAGAKLNNVNKAQKTALHFTAENGNIEFVYRLLSSGADPDAVDFQGMTPLHLAAKNGKTEVIRLLLAAGAHL